MSELYLLSLVVGLSLFAAILVSRHWARRQPSTNVPGFMAKVDAIFSVENFLMVLFGFLLFIAAALTWISLVPLSGESSSPTLAEGYYWAAQTATTVGYGDGLHQHDKDFVYSRPLHVLCTYWMLIFVLYWGKAGIDATATVVSYIRSSN